MDLKYLARQLWLSIVARSSGDYWERRYAVGLTSGAGSYASLAAYKAAILNDFVQFHGIESVVELGCGDGNQLLLARYPRYLGMDVSATAIDICAQRFRKDRSKSFLWMDPDRSVNLAAFIQADLTLSLDVIYHLIEDETYLRYLDNLFSISGKYAILYSSNMVQPRRVRHVRHRKFTEDVSRLFPQFRLNQHLSNPHQDKTFAEFFIYQRVH